ncbi:unnamed protein product [Scytosiphon promiscuus]
MQRPWSKADVRCDDLLRATSNSTRHHMEPDWAAVELLDYIGEELNHPECGAREKKQRSSQMTLDAIRVLPEPVAGDLFVTCAARGHIGVILFYFQEGLPIDHSHTTLKYEALHAAVEFGHLDSARLLVAMGAKVDARGGVDDRSPLFLAALAKRWDACAWLLQAGASKLIRDKKGLTAYQAMAGSSDPEVAGRSGMLTDPPQRIVSVACRGITHSSLDLTWSEPLRSYDEEVFVGYMVEWRPMRSRPVCPAFTRHIAEREESPLHPSRSFLRRGWEQEGAKGEKEVEQFPKHDDGSNAPTAAAVAASQSRRPNTRGGETTVDADGCCAEAIPWKAREVDKFPLELKHLHPATNYVVRVSAKSLAGFGVPSREALLCTRVAPPSAPKKEPGLVSATPNSITVGWIPPKYENGEPITRYEIQRLVLDQNHPDWDKGRETISTESREDITTNTTTGSTGDDGSASGSSSNHEEKSSTNATVTTTTSETESASLPQKISETAGGDRALGTRSATDLGPPGKQGSPEDPGVKLPPDMKQVGVWIGQRTERMTPYHTAGGLPTYCRALFRVRAGNRAGWGAWSPLSDALEAQDIILPVKRGATHMLMRWFNKPEGDVLRWELSRRVFKYGTDFRGDDDESWALCSRDIPGLTGGESTFRCKGLMPGIEYQFRLRSFSNGSWQAREEAIVSSPFKTICSPPDPPPTCPRSRQLESDPLVLGGLADTGSLLAATSDNRRDTNSVGPYRAIEETLRDGNGKTGVGDSGRTAGATRAAATAAAVVRGKAQAEAEWDAGQAGIHGGSMRRSVGDHGDDDVGIEQDGGNSREENVESVAEDVGNEAGRGSNRKRWKSDGEGSCRRQAGPEARDRSGRAADEGLPNGHEKQDVGKFSVAFPALSDPTREETYDGAREVAQESWKSGAEDSSMTGATGSGLDGSTTIVLDWDPGCTNGAITTNYEVWGMAESIDGQMSGSGEWAPVMLTEAAPTATLSGLREASAAACTHDAQPYQFKVRARNGLGWSEFGPPTPPIVLNPLQPCEPPELVDRGVTWLALRLRAPPRAGLLLGFEMQMCRWSPGMAEGEETWSLVAGSIVERGKGGKFSEASRETSTSTSSTKTTTPTSWSAQEESRMVWDLKPGARYRFKARAQTAFGWSPGGSASEIYHTARRF